MTGTKLARSRIAILLLAFSLLLQAPSAKAAPMREFIMACTYGVLAGTLVGAASLAFTSQPGDNLGRVARGASLGLYAGIFLGVYVVYVVPGQIRQEQDLQQDYGLPPEEGQDTSSNFQVFPLLTERGVEGVAANWQLLSF